MWLGKIEGKVWCSSKAPELEGIVLLIMQPVTERQRPQGPAVVAVDTVGAGEGDLVYWVNSTEAGFACKDRDIPSEVSIVGLVDDLSLWDADKDGNGH